MKAVSRPVPAASSDRLTQALKPVLCGVDLMEVGRFEREVSRRGDALVEELFSAGERAWCRRRRRPAEGHAMIFAAKEALVKALGTGLVGRMNWRDIELTWPGGPVRPVLTLSGETAAVAASAGAAEFHVALACTRTLAVAWVVAAGLGIRDSGLGIRVSRRDGTSQPRSGTARAPSPESRAPTIAGERSQWQWTTSNFDAT